MNQLISDKIQICKKDKKKGKIFINKKIKNYYDLQEVVNEYCLKNSIILPVDQ